VPGSARNDWEPADGRYPPQQADNQPVPGSDPSAGGIPNPRDASQHGSPPYRTSEGAGSSLVRPYAVTGGRTKPRYQLQIEAMVAASHYEARDLSVLSPECQAILGFCRDWRSVAEISAVLRMPLGVARVLIADMAVQGLVRVHQMDHAHGRPDLNLLERVLSGLRKL
jgi:Protein of unknown function (DUF742)